MPANRIFMASMTALVFCFLFSVEASAGELWWLVDSHFTGREWYCTYQLTGTEIQTTIVSKSVCRQSVYL